MAQTFLKENQAIASDGWQRVTDSWTYASASTINVPSGAASLYQKGDRIKWTQTTVKYGVIVAVADTLLTIAVNTDYTVANAAISAIYYSHQANPLGYPTTFTYTVNVTSGYTATVSATWKYSIIGNTCYIHYLQDAGGTSNASTVIILLPVPCLANIYNFGIGYGKDNGSNLSAPLNFELGQSGDLTKVTVYKTFYENGFTTSGSKQVFTLNGSYQF